MRMSVWKLFMSARVIPTPRRVAIDTSTSVASKECDTDTMTCRQSDSRASEEGTRLSTSTRSSTKLASAHMELDAEARIRQVVEEEERANRDRTSSSILRVGNNSTEALRFKYMRCDEAKPKECTIDLRVNSNPLLGDSALVAAGKWYWAIPWEGAGGNIFIAPHDMPQKVPSAPLSLLRAHDVALGDLSFPLSMETFLRLREQMRTYDFGKSPQNWTI